MDVSTNIKIDSSNKVGLHQGLNLVYSFQIYQLSVFITCVYVRYTYIHYIHVT